MNKVLFLTSTNLACNPRCLKEVRLAVSNNYEVTVVAFNLHNWTNDKEEALKKELSTVTFYYLEATKIDFLPWIVSSLIEKACRMIAPAFKNSLYVNANAVSKRNWLLLKWAKRNKIKTDLIIAHNPATFYPALKLSKALCIPFAIDIEDYHPGEGKDKFQKNSVALLIKKTLPETTYTSYASPFIKIYTEKLLTAKAIPQGIVVNNTFSAMDFLPPVQGIAIGDKLKLVWFSQFIDYGRGLEKIFPVLDKFMGSIELTLIGNLREGFNKAELEQRTYVRHLPSLSQKELNNELSKYDIGLALEDRDADFNRTICLTNKIWAYYQAGLYILASDTEAQSDFIANYPAHGALMSFNKEEVLNRIKISIEQKGNIRFKKTRRFENAQKQCWENESEVLIQEWQTVFIN